MKKYKNPIADDDDDDDSMMASHNVNEQIKANACNRLCVVFTAGLKFEWWHVERTAVV
jgi:hypothetical protein